MPKKIRKLISHCGQALLFSSLCILYGCTTSLSPERQADRASLQASIHSEIPGNYFVGRRFYKQDYKMWGWVRSPGQSWTQAKLVMLNEQEQLAPDRAQGHIGGDNNYEYWLKGFFSGKTVYEPASDRFYPEFVLQKYEIRSTAPPLIFAQPQAIDPTVRLLTPPSE